MALCEKLRQVDVLSLLFDVDKGLKDHLSVKNLSKEYV